MLQTRPRDHVVVVVPTYGEFANLQELTSRLWAADPDVHVLIVDDYSGDGTPEWVRAHRSFGVRLTLLERPSKLGLAGAYRDGFARALEDGADVIVQMDADLSHDPADVPRLIEAVGIADLAIGTRYRGGVRVLNWPVSRLVLSLVAARFVRIATGMDISDPTGGFKAWRSELLGSMRFDEVRSNGYAFQVEMTHLAWREGARIEEVPIVFTERRSGQSKMTPSITVEALVRVLALSVSRFRHRGTNS